MKRETGSWMCNRNAGQDDRLCHSKVGKVTRQERFLLLSFGFYFMSCINRQVEREISKLDIAEEQEDGKKNGKKSGAKLS